MKRFRFLVASLGMTACALSFHVGAFAQSSTVSSETTVQTRGVGFKGANVFNPKYKERIGTYAEQIEMGQNKGWLTPEEVSQFKSRLEGMKQQEAAAAAKGWVKSDIDAIDKVFTQFNIDLTKAANKPAPSANSAKSDDETTDTAPSTTTKNKTTTKAVTKKAAAAAKTTTKKTVSKKATK